MGLLLEEHGESIIYGIIGIFMVLLISNITQKSWRALIPSPYIMKVEDSEKYIKEYKNNYPKISADEVIFVNYKNTGFNIKDYFSATDYRGKDISERVKVYGSVDVNKKGIHIIKIKVNDNNYITTKIINVIVE